MQDSIKLLLAFICIMLVPYIIDLVLAYTDKDYDQYKRVSNITKARNKLVGYITVSNILVMVILLLVYSKS